MDRIVSSWQGLGSREQIMVCFGVVALLLGLVFLLAVNPLLNWQETTQKRLNQTIADTTLVQQLAARVNAQKQAGDQGSQDLGQHPLVQKWWDFMADLMEVNPDNSPVSKPLEEVFYLA